MEYFRHSIVNYYLIYGKQKECFLRIVQPILLGFVIRFFANPEKHDFTFACLSAAGVVACSFVYVITYHPAAVLEVRTAIKARITWCTLMYKKALKLKPSAFGKTTIGQILNLMSNDVSRFDEVFLYSYLSIIESRLSLQTQYSIIGLYMFVAPMQTIIGLYVCWLYIGWVCFIGLGILLLFIPFNSFIGRLFLKIRFR